MKQFIKLSLFLSLVLIMVVGCSNNEDDEGNAVEEENSSQETSAEQETDNEGGDENSENTNGNNDTYVEHQEGLKMGETGIIEDNDEKYEVTLNSVSYDDDITGGADVETFAIVNITVKNIDDHSFDAKNIYEPSFGPDGEFQSSLNSVLMDTDNIEQDLLEGEITPGESVSGDHVFGVAEKKDDYLFIIGGRGHQIRTYAQWEVSDSEIE